ncbi:MAG TPA: DUF2891 domain-containing protein [Candidatus Limnocylindria bacterium]|nr:DUF2891 domain-containing protein [Candidatus Limnocylindria bacterium]
MTRLDGAIAERLARMAVDNVAREYPNAPGHLLRSAADLRPPREIHPCFYGSYDWHSCVHQHWLLARLLRLERAGSQTDAARAALAALTPERLEIEAAYLREHPAFERTYGWAWLLALADEMDSDVLVPAVAGVRTNWMAHLPDATYPIRAGTHANSAFGLALAIDHARAAGDQAFESALVARALDWFADDRDYPARLEPGGDDFLSGALMEASLMTRVIGSDAFAAWWAAFLPNVPASLTEPAVVTDRSDPKLAHLDGLNLSRAWCWRTIASVTGDAAAEAAAERHLDGAMPHLFSGEYAGEHWIGTFALLALDGA